jgi:hypothetical protein
MGRHKGLTADDYRGLAEKGMTMPEAAAHLSVTVQTVWLMAKKYGIAFTAGKRGRKKSVQAVQA